LGGWIEEEEDPEETHIDRGTQTDGEDKHLPIKKRFIWTEEESP
jgi:hypothetical protein